jgi:hypothetical protein
MFDVAELRRASLTITTEKKLHLKNHVLLTRDHVLLLLDNHYFFY